MAPSTQPPTILIVDDHPDNLKTLSKLLASQGWEIRVATDGWIALEQAEYNSPDLILLDVMMPEIDGFETCRRFKAHPTLHEIPIIFMTALDQATNRMKGFEAGGVDYITKPYQTEEILARINVHLQLRILTKVLEEKNEQLHEKNLALQQEIIQHQKTEAALRSREEQFRQLTDNIREVFYIYDLDPYQVIYISPGFEDIWGVSRDQVVQNLELWANSIHPEDRDRVIQAAAQQTQGYPFQEEYRITRSDGEIRWISARSSPVQDQTGKFYRIVGICEDITARKQAELALQTSETQNRAILSAIPDIMTVISGKGEYLNFASNQFMGEVIPLAFRGADRAFVNEVLPTDAAEKCLTAIQKALVTGQIQSYEHQIQFGDRIQYEEVRIVPYQHDRVLCMVRNISDRKQAEAQIRASLQEKEALLAEIHHRVKNNLQIISSLLNLQAYKIDDPQVRKALEDSWTRIDSMALVHETLYRSQDFSKINFAEYLENLAQNLFHTYNTQSDPIHLDIQASCDISFNLNLAIPCGLIINELITNALKHAFKPASKQSSPGELFVHLVQTDDQRIQLSVGNSGNSLPPNFNPYKTRSMGLQLVTSLVKQLEGTLEVIQGDRTIFCITFDPNAESKE